MALAPRTGRPFSVTGVLVIGAWLLLSRGPLPHASAQSTSFACTEVLGFSQTMQWYFGAPGYPSFVSLAGPGQWQLRWEGGGDVGNWADPNYSGWTSQYLVTGCSQGSANPDRVLFNITGGNYISDANWWVQEINL